MDYCHPCRRHLNGALACPGCGTPAEACREYAEALAAQEVADGADDAYEEEAEFDGGGRRGRRGHRGRASLRARRRRRRRTLLIGAGLVLAVGGLSLTELGLEAPGDDQAASAPDAVADDSVDGSPTGASSARPIGGEVSPSAADRGSAGASPSASESEKGKKKKKGEEDKSGDGQSSPGAGSSGAAPTPSATGSTVITPTTSAPRPTASAPAPDPEPSQTCTRFLWWCT
ncbi:SCO2400 family protein [Streptomyces sp. NPDC002577]